MFTKALTIRDRVDGQHVGFLWLAITEKWPGPVGLKFRTLSLAALNTNHTATAYPKFVDGIMEICYFKVAFSLILITGESKENMCKVWFV